MERNGKRFIGGLVFYFVITGILFGIIWFISSKLNNENSYGYVSFEKDLEEERIAGISIMQNAEAPTGSISVFLKDGSTKNFYTVNTSDIFHMAIDAGLDPVVKDVKKTSVFLTSILPLLITLVAMFLMFSAFSAQANGGNNQKLMNFGQSRAKMLISADGKVTTFADVAGVDEEKDELFEVVDFLKNPKKYLDVGARIPKGIILVGPPGTGKTLLAKAVAGEAGVPFFSISGSDFVEMFVGVGASRVRDMFDEAKKYAPCIIFIDEIDAVARRRGAGMGGGHDEREQTLNQLLVEMDGFTINQGIIVMAATNRVDILDPAIMRPGRFDRKIYVDSPDVRGREDILKIHAKNKPLSDDIDLHEIAQTTSGFTGADLENLLNEAAILAAKGDVKFLRKEDVKKAFIKVGIGVEKKSRIVSDRERRLTAFHESGHAILFHLLPDVGPVYTVSIIPTGNAGGFTMPLPENDEMYITKGRLLQDIIVSLGGRAAEEIVFDDVTTGASQDIKKATQAARRMVVRYGFSDTIGHVCYDNDEDEVFIGRDYGHTKEYSENTANAIDNEIKRIVEECYEEAKSMLSGHMTVLNRCAELLLEKERIGREEFEALFAEETEATV